MGSSERRKKQSNGGICAPRRIATRARAGIIQQPAWHRRARHGMAMAWQGTAGLCTRSRFPPGPAARSPQPAARQPSSPEPSSAHPPPAHPPPAHHHRLPTLCPPTSASAVPPPRGTRPRSAPPDARQPPPIHYHHHHLHPAARSLERRVIPQTRRCIFQPARPSSSFPAHLLLSLDLFCAAFTLP